jgi:Alternative complex III, ActD subunit
MGERSGCPMRDAHWPNGAYAAEFDDEEPFAAAVSALHDHGYVKVEAYSPYPVPAVDATLATHRSVLPFIVFVGGVFGATLGYWIQWYTNVVSYPLNIGGRPAHATPAFFIPTFETTVLCAALAAFCGLFALLRLPRPWHPLFEVDDFERASIDHFWIAIDARDPSADSTLTPRALELLHARRVVHIPASST